MGTALEVIGNAGCCWHSTLDADCLSQGAQAGASGIIESVCGYGEYADRACSNGEPVPETKTELKLENVDLTALVNDCTKSCTILSEVQASYAEAAGTDPSFVTISSALKDKCGCEAGAAEAAEAAAAASADASGRMRRSLQSAAASTLSVEVTITGADAGESVANVEVAT